MLLLYYDRRQAHTLPWQPNIGEIHYHIENKTNGGKHIEFSAESNQFEKKSKVGINEMFSNC